MCTLHKPVLSVKVTSFAILLALICVVYADNDVFSQPEILVLSLWKREVLSVKVLFGFLQLTEFFFCVVHVAWKHGR